MSRTDKDDPYWVRIQYDGFIQHDHRDGRCAISDGRQSWRKWIHHWRKCKKRVKVEYTCTKQDAHQLRRSWGGGYSARYGEMYDYNGYTCWTWVCGCDNIPDSWRNESHGDCKRVRVGCIGHTKVEYHDEIPCACDARDEVPTCFPKESAVTRFSIWGDGGVPHWYVRDTWHGPERGREKSGLRDAMIRYNSGDDLEDFDFENRQARNGARWSWY